ncbi:MAG: hypothetical protein F6J93_17070 [Oscillatoria sp. SIO1A7]|nr:hypothetical protein [Oscillatoria sp. SIO1A7]
MARVSRFGFWLMALVDFGDCSCMRVTINHAPCPRPNSPCPMPNYFFDRST